VTQTVLYGVEIIPLSEEAFVNDPPLLDNEFDILYSEQVAADAGNFGASNQWIQSCMPIINITDQLFKELQIIYPEQLTFAPHNSEDLYPQFLEKEP
jgi:hypothetical protein